jgi:hypothetical protein
LVKHSTKIDLAVERFTGAGILLGNCVNEIKNIKRECIVDLKARNYTVRKQKNKNHLQMAR